MIPELEQLGFTRNEANVYYAALKLGVCSVQQIANATGLNRITVHSIAEKFESLQILTRSYEGKRRRVAAVSPHRL
jgi:sugar-specific transcriptional regulator TrmB